MNVVFAVDIRAAKARLAGLADRLRARLADLIAPDTDGLRAAELSRGAPPRESYAGRLPQRQGFGGRIAARSFAGRLGGADRTDEIHAAVETALDEALS